MSGSRRLDLIQVEAGLHSPEGQRHFAALRSKSAPANAQVPCSQVGGPGGFLVGMSLSGMIGSKLRGDAVEASVEQRLVRSQLRGEAIERVDRGGISEGAAQSVVVGDERGRAAPRRDRVQGLDEAGADKRTDRVALAAGP